MQNSSNSERSLCRIFYKKAVEEVVGEEAETQATNVLTVAMLLI